MYFGEDKMNDTNEGGTALIRPSVHLHRRAFIFIEVLDNLVKY